ncbi:phosphate transport system protein [Mycobacterium sp. MAA66]|jgi:phosphate transport system protein|uniref:phosphate signaling complex PhoU family protein n=1 Tax=Mycobacterium sp. MAA66 TaxID=3156297 RepID=UPI0035153FEC
MPTTFHGHLETLTTGVSQLCDLVGESMRQATVSLSTADLVLAEEVLGRQNDIAYECGRLEATAFNALALRAPIDDQRVALSLLKSVADVQRMSALMLHIARIARRRHPAHAVPAELRGSFAAMGLIAVRLASDAGAAVQRGDGDQGAELAARDDALDALHRRVFSFVLEQDWPHGTTAAVDATLLSRYYERFADHAVQIAGRVGTPPAGGPAWRRRTPT